MPPAMLVSFLSSLLMLLSTTTATASSPNCKDFLIPVNFTAPQYDLGISIESNWDVENYIVNLTRRDTLTAFQPIIGNRTVSGRYNIGATFCTPETQGQLSSTVLLLTHGSMVDGSYWNPTFNGSDRYNFVQHMLAAGYSVFYYDRLGNGRSSRPDPLDQVQTAPQVQILTALTKLLRVPHSQYTPGVTARRIVHVGHSYGSLLTVDALAANPAPGFSDAMVLTGFSGNNAWFQVLTAGAQGRIAALAQPQTWSHLPYGYLVPVDKYASMYGAFKSPYFSHQVAETFYQTGMPYSIGELQTAATVATNLSQITVPVQVVQGKYDMPQCGGNCDGILNTTATLFPNSPKVVVNGSFNAGHAINFHYDAEDAFSAITNFLATTLKQ